MDRIRTKSWRRPEGKTDGPAQTLHPSGFEFANCWERSLPNLSETTSARRRSLSSLMIRVLLTVLATSTAAPFLWSADPLPGHSAHGETFNEGPRQAAVLIEGCGKVSFPATTKSTMAQQFVNQGVGQLHGFWYYEAERSFRQALTLDPDCAIAYWGCAMANVNNEKRAAGFIAEATKRKDKASKREQAWIAALQTFYADLNQDKKSRHTTFIKDLEDIIHDNSDDIEAKAFLAWAIWKAKDAGVTMVSRESVDALPVSYTHLTLPTKA